MLDPHFLMSARDLLLTMVTAREGDRREGVLVRQGAGSFHVSCSGHEGLAALVYLLKPNDDIFPYYRDKAVAYARGVSIEETARVFFAKASSSAVGRNMPSHLSSRELGFFSAATPTGSQCLPAAGAAWAKKLLGRDDDPMNVSLCFIGDAATRQGEFYEAVCFAVQERLPIVFVVEDNKYGISTPTDTMTPLHLGIFAPELITAIDGRDAENVFVRGRGLVEKARAGGGPGILWCRIDRLDSHTSADDHRVYRSAGDLETAQANDPIKILSEKLIANGVVTAASLHADREEIKGRVRSAYENAAEESGPDSGDIAQHLYGPATSRYPDLSLSLPSPAPVLPTMVDAVNGVLRASLASDPRTLIFGQDVEDPKGGVFGLTRGLSGAFPGRVLNSPLAEATIVGAAVGLAATGIRPIFELQFMDFIGTALNQLYNQAATLRWRSGGEWTCPFVLYAPYGAYIPGGGIWHSQSNEALLAHMPGLRVAVPSTPADAAGLFWAAAHDDDPTVILLPKHLLRERVPVEHYAVVPFGSAAIRREGTDVTLVAWGNCVEICMEAASRLQNDRISAEVIDLRSLVPCDWESLTNSLRKTGRIVIVQEDVLTCSFGQAIVSEITTEIDRFYMLAAPPRLVSRMDVHMPFCVEQEYQILPSVDRVIAAVVEVLQ
ncbi:hypothetical protein CCAX7_64730 [Capsulimonas corticalis]|uniref:Uncharacterized protein n=1 Tax=Capsulimonas corticalis TaxID=2219043 RepID=A0A402CQX3_9BACT|nr:alpha-ketoacid dehydrogenase subunit alpha/beta [Capsulimonas corticalis]BDI34422.1 hypothetical protein CCAX7_64730 [Capsulimonas corticalis]